MPKPNNWIVKKETDPNRQKRLEQIHEHAEHLQKLANEYRKLMWMAENDASGAFLDLAEAAGRMTISSLDQLGTLLEILWRAGENDLGRDDAPDSE